MRLNSAGSLIVIIIDGDTAAAASAGVGPDKDVDVIPNNMCISIIVSANGSFFIFHRFLIMRIFPLIYS
jgi:hypothetical protein